MQLRLKLKRLRPDAKLPKRAYDSAGYDLFPCESGTVQPGERAMIPLGFATAFTPGYVAVVDDRGSVGNQGVTHLAGVIDADFRGEWKCIMHNLGNTPWRYSPDKAIAQVLFLKVESPDPEVVEELPETARGAGMLGSSGH